MERLGLVIRGRHALAQRILAPYPWRLPQLKGYGRRSRHRSWSGLWRLLLFITAQKAGFYKPRREPYARTLAALDPDPKYTLFVAGSAADVPGASAPGMSVYWHNRVGQPATNDAKLLYHERTLNRLREIA